MKSHVPKVTTNVECPQLKQQREVSFEVNVFRGADRGGVEAISCSEFAHTKEAPPCGQDCIHTEKAHAIHQQEVEKHQQELGKIGRHVIG